MKSLVFFMSLLVLSLTAPLPDSDSDETPSNLQLKALYRLLQRLQQPEFNGFYQAGGAAPVTSDEAEEDEEESDEGAEGVEGAEGADAAEGVEGAEGADGAEGAEGGEGAEGAEPTTYPAAVSTDAPVDPELPLDYLLATLAPYVEFNVADGFYPAAGTESSLP